MENKICKKCGAHWISGQLYWSTGSKGEERDLAGLVCNDYGNEDCINPAKGTEGGQTWAERAEQAKRMLEEELERRNR